MYRYKLLKVFVNEEIFAMDSEKGLEIFERYCDHCENCENKGINF